MVCDLLLRVYGDIIMLLIKPQTIYLYRFPQCYSAVTPPAILLLPTMAPLIKNESGNNCDSNNYRATAISSLLGKSFDTVLLKLQHTSLFTDSL